MKPFTYWVLPSYILLLTDLAVWNLPRPFRALLVPSLYVPGNRC